MEPNSKITIFRLAGEFASNFISRAKRKNAYMSQTINGVTYYTSGSESDRKELWKGWDQRKYRRERLTHERAPTRPKPSSCEVCSESKRKICYDHDHKASKFRGWLCGNCNAALGFAKDSPAILRKLADYLEHGPLVAPALAVSAAELIPTANGCTTVINAKSSATGKRRMAARNGQGGHIEPKGKYWRVRFRIGVPGQLKRQHKSVRICPIKGEGALSKTERERKALAIIAAEGAISEKRAVPSMKEFTESLPIQAPAESA